MLRTESSAKAEPHLETLDLLVFSIGDVIQATCES